MSNVQNREATQPTAYDDLSDAADAILDRWADGEDLSADNEELEATDEPSNEETEEDTSDTQDDEEQDYEEVEETDEDPDNDDTEDPDEPETEEEDDETEVLLSDDTMVEISVDGEVKQASLKDLKRLHGQEASLTRKSQEVAAKRKEAEDALGKAHISYQKLLERAEARMKPYAEVDMLVASRQMSTEDFAAFRRESQEAEKDLKFLQEESNAFYKDAQAQQQKQVQEAATECIKVLRNDLPDWGDELYNDIRNYAVSQGLPQEQVDQYVDPQVIKILNKARLYDQTKATAETKKAKAKVIKTKQSKGRVLKAKKSPSTRSDDQRAKQQKARERLRSSTDLDDVTDALMARWER
tara:strand:+ start:453 stop:1517 length:1065 start_codon:yes stop_codon:yes gene_type:complete